MLGWVAATGDFGRSWDIIFNSVFLAIPIFELVVFLYEDYEKAGFYVANRKKKIKVSLQLFYIQFGYISLCLL
jgi:heme O synthase-like polyprenyltransferase